MGELTFKVVSLMGGFAATAIRMAKRYRGPLSNPQEFQRVWNCKADSAMVRAEGKRCEVW
jgi:hypothetical protein